MHPQASVRPRRRLVLGGVLVLTVLAGVVVGTRDGVADAKYDVDLIRGPTSCVECHEQELKVWKQTHHADSKKVLFSKEGRAVIKKLGLKGLPHKQELCQQCHVTLYSDGGKHKPRVKWGVSCESCHGASENWIDVHRKYAPYDSVLKEPEEHRLQRLEAAQEQGMILPSDIFSLATNCFGCHTVPQEALVNKGGHPAGSAEFELLSWSQGEVRHRFMRGNGNKPAPIGRRRILYVVGQMADVYGSLRSLAQATEDGAFSKAMVQRVHDAKARLKAIAEALGDGPAGAAVSSFVAAIPEAELKPAHADALTKVATTLGEQGRSFAATYADGSALSGVDDLLPNEMRGKPLTD